jgi:hypothetical protein
MIPWWRHFTSTISCTGSRSVFCCFPQIEEERTKYKMKVFATKSNILFFAVVFYSIDRGNWETHMALTKSFYHASFIEHHCKVFVHEGKREEPIT